MLNHTFTHFLGQRIENAQEQIEDQFFGKVVIMTPGQEIEQKIVKPSRLQVHVDDQGVITRIING